MSPGAQSTVTALAALDVERFSSRWSAGVPPATKTTRRAGRPRSNVLSLLKKQGRISFRRSVSARFFLKGMGIHRHWNQDEFSWYATEFALEAALFAHAREKSDRMYGYLCLDGERKLPEIPAMR
ncbi:MAG: hypothetical protein LBI59_03935 [Candidatus Accumulibacter sp.]|jgi:hypothetical protein|nr:hypothetical protein [Accumulibacter sp.]